MTTYAIGDIQGCYDPLRRLLDKINFNPDNDTLWVAGDMVNRGPESLKTLRFLKNLGESCITILGNHDLYLLAVDSGIKKQKKKDTLEHILTAPDKNDLLHWLRHRPFLYHSTKKKITMIHAGIPPVWTLAQAKKYAGILEQKLQADDYNKLLETLFKSKKQLNWEDTQGQKKKLRLAANYFTRMRFCDAEGRMHVNNTSATPNPDFAPWYSFKHAPMYAETILFGHWAALDGKTGRSNIHALDTGCVWGRKLTALNLKTLERISVKNSS